MRWQIRPREWRDESNWSWTAREVETMTQQAFKNHEEHDVEYVRGYVGPDDDPQNGRPYPFCHTCNEDLSHLEENPNA